MKSIINPLWFYFIGVSKGLTSVGMAFAILGVVVTIIMLVCFTCEQNMYRPNEKNVAFFKKNAKRCFIISLISIFVAIFIPSEKTCYQMMAASIVTPNNIETVIDTTKDEVEWLIDTINKASETLSDNGTESADE